MYTPLEAFIGLRYVRAKRRNHFISFISMISMLGIALGVTTLITVISVMNGFEKELRARILGAIAHATIQPVDGALVEWRNVIGQVAQHPEVDGAAPYIEEGVWLQGQESAGAFIRGIDPVAWRTSSRANTALSSGSASPRACASVRAIG
jgi:lipoprotein-releasing system permease protein